MGRAFHLGTFDSERWWRPPELAVLPAVVLGDVGIATMDELLAGFCAPGDLLLTRAPMAPALRAGLAEWGIDVTHRTVGTPEHPAAGAHADTSGSIEELALRDPRTLGLLAGYDVLSPYAVLPDTARLAERVGATNRLPSATTVARVNSKSWSNTVVDRLDLPGAGEVVRSVDALTSAVRRTGFDAVVKDPYGVSGRGMLAVRTPGVLAAIRRALDRQVAAGRRIELLVQPRYARQCDFSAHLSLAPDGGWELLGVQVMTNREFRFIGSRPADPAFVDRLDASGYLEALAEVAKALAGEGYWGPVGVDSMLQSDGEVIPILEVNARRSLGLLALLLDHRVRDERLRCHLWQIDMTVAPGRDVDALVTALRADGAAYRGGSRPGVVVLSGSGLRAPGGRVHCALLCRPDDLAATQARMLAAVATAGMTPRGVINAA
ncbi:hypothetical protein [Micromonospora sp. KC723]|uniref:hypothetical protein n=1 Tax=Micromonospora sp. KC723 TaxID=2530381 RepID=UPI0010441843|nr:hypothetical protein [Micromonospora sp. KC723]TDB78371.1 hypothetical protein E1165_01360 [Micromonospora sp. KC723]